MDLLYSIGTHNISLDLGPRAAQSANVLFHFVIISLWKKNNIIYKHFWSDNIPSYSLLLHNHPNYEWIIEQCEI